MIIDGPLCVYDALADAAEERNTIDFIELEWPGYLPSALHVETAEAASGPEETWLLIGVTKLCWGLLFAEGRRW